MTKLQVTKKSLKLLEIKVFITTGNDAESHFLNENHVAEIYPAIDPDRVKELIDESILERREKILEKYINTIYNRRLQESYKGGDKPNAGAISIECTANLDQHRRRYMHGKITESTLRGKLQRELGTNVDLCKITPHLENPHLRAFAAEIWQDDNA
jgi:hypothetical protein